MAVFDFPGMSEKIVEYLLNRLIMRRCLSFVILGQTLTSLYVALDTVVGSTMSSVSSFESASLTTLFASCTVSVVVTLQPRLVLSI